MLFSRITFPVNIRLLSFLSLHFCDCMMVAPWEPDTNSTRVHCMQSLQPRSFSYCQTPVVFAGPGVLLLTDQNPCLYQSWVWGDQKWGVTMLHFAKVSTCEAKCVCLAGILSSPLLPGLLPVCKLLAMYREANRVREATWATVCVSLQGMAPATGLHSPGQLGCTWHWATEEGKSGFKPFILLSNTASPQHISSQTPLTCACCMWFLSSIGIQPYVTYISAFVTCTLLGKERDGQYCYISSESTRGRNVTSGRHPGTKLLAGAVWNRGWILDRDPRRSCPPFCLKAGSHTSELPLTDVCVICFLKPLTMEI